MAKKSMMAREKKRANMVVRFAKRRFDLKKIIKDPNTSFEERSNAQEALQRLPRDACPVRQRNRCSITGRPHGYYRKFGLARNKLRQSMMQGDVPGLVKASW